MRQFIFFLKKRVPLVPYGIFSLLIALDPFFLMHIPINFFHLFLSFLGIFLLLIQMRLLDDIQDISIDKIAHKDRPFPSGKIALHDGERISGLFQVGMLIFSSAVFFFGSYTGFFFFVACVVYIWNTYKGFYFEDWMRSHPFLAFILSELVFFPMMFFSFALVDETRAFDYTSIAFAFLLFLALIIYDIARKLDPKAHPILQNFVHLLGYRRVFLGLTPLFFLSFLIGDSLQLSPILWPVQIAAFLSLALVLFSSLRWFFAASCTLLSLFIHAASPLLLYGYEHLTKTLLK